MSDLPLPLDLPVDLPIVEDTLGTVTSTLPELPTVSVTVGTNNGAAGVTLDGTNLAGGGTVSL